MARMVHYFYFCLNRFGDLAVRSINLLKKSIAISSHLVKENTHMQEKLHRNLIELVSSEQNLNRTELWAFGIGAMQEMSCGKESWECGAELGKISLKTWRERFQLLDMTNEEMTPITCSSCILSCRFLMSLHLNFIDFRDLLRLYKMFLLGSSISLSSTRCTPF